jgi:hypothetical protein
MPKKKAKGSAKKARKRTTVKDLPAKSLGADKASSVKGGVGLESSLTSLKINKIAPSTTAIKIERTFTL